MISQKLKQKIQRMIETYNEQLEKIRKGIIKRKEDLTKDKTKISWSRTLQQAIFSPKAKKTNFEKAGIIVKTSYRPFVDMYLYFSRLFIHEVKKFPQIFPIPSAENVVMFFTGTGVLRFSTLISKYIVDYNALSPTVAIPLYLYQPLDEIKKKKQLFE